MNLLQAIHSRWAAAEDLNSLLPAARVFTGASFDAALPWASILKRSDRPESYETDGSAIDLVVLRVRVYHAQHEAASEIIGEVKKTFNRASFELDGGDIVLDIHRVNDFERQRDDGAWEMTLDLEFRVYLATGA